MQDKVYRTATQARHTLCPMHFAPNAPYNTANTFAHDTYNLSDPPPKKKDPSTKLIWPIAFAGELGHVVSRVLPHVFFFGDMSKDTQVRDSRRSRDWCLLEFYLYVSGSVGGAWGVRFRWEPASVTPSRCTYERKLLPNSSEQILNPRPRNNFLNPESYSEVGATNPEIICETNFVVANPTYWRKTRVNHVNQRVPRTSEPRFHQERKAARLLAQVFFILYCFMLM